MRKFTIILLALLVSVQAWSSTPDWRKRLVEAGRHALQKAQQQNARNDRRGKSDENNYLIIVSAADYPNGDFLKQQAGSGRGGKSYLLDPGRLSDLDNTLRTINVASDIKTYVLVIHFMPMEFSATIPDDQSLKDFFQGHATPFVQAIAQPMMDEARTLVEAITAPDLSKADKPTLYCGFVNFKVFKNEEEGISQWIYYPRNTNINFKEEYQSMLKSSVERTPWPVGDASKVGKLVDVIKNINEEYRKLKDVLPELIAITDPVEMEKRLEGMSINSLASFDVALRVHVLKVLSSQDIPDTRETLIVRLIEAVQTADDANQLIIAMSLANDRVPATRILPFDNTVVANEKKDWCLLRCITNETDDATLGVWRADNYQRLIKSLIALCKVSSSFKAKVSALAGNDDLFATRTIYYNYHSFWQKFANTVTYYPQPKLDRSTNYTGDCDLKTETALFFSYIVPNNAVASELLDPFEPIVFVNQSDLGMLSNIDDAGNTFVAPAIVLKYADDKAWNQTATDATMAAIDAASLATGYGELKAGVTGMRKAWTLMDMANSGINLTLNATLSTNNETVSKILASYNLVTGGVSITGNLRSAFRATRGKELLNRADITTLFKNIDEAQPDALRSFSDGDLQSIRKLAGKVELEAEARSLTEIEQQAERVVQKISSVTQPLPAWAADFPAALKADIGTIDSDLGRLFAAASDVRRKELVQAWEVLNNAGLSWEIRKRPANLERLVNGLKQDGYGKVYFENLLKAKADPQQFINDYISKIGEEGKFIDSPFERDYEGYISRKVKESKPPRDRSDWNHTRDYMLNDSPLARGNSFNRKAWEEEWYPAWEVQLDNGKFIDGYNPFTKEIVSRKATDLVDISENTFINYLDEMLQKYAPPKKITTKKQGFIYDQLRATPDLPMDSQLILEIPESNKSFFEIDRYTQIAANKGIKIRFRPE